MGNNACICGDERLQTSQQLKYQAFAAADPNHRIQKAERKGLPKMPQYAIVENNSQNQKLIIEYKQNDRKLKPLKIGRNPIPGNDLSDVYKIPYQSAFYLGEWVDRGDKTVPCGIGRLYTQDFISQGEIDTYQTELQSGGSVLETGLHGRGRKYNKTKILQGVFQKGLLHGKGTYENKQTGYFYDGDWTEGRRNGKGREVTSTHTYTGQFYFDKRQGKGIFQSVIHNQQKKLVEQQEKVLQSRYREYESAQQAHRDRIDQSLKKQQEVKSKIEAYLNSELKWEKPFKGQTLDSNPQFVKQRAVRKYYRQLYDGDFYDNQYHGIGMYIWLSGKIYRGQWNNGKMDGQGQFYWPDGTIYRGQYLDDRKHGKGEMMWCYQRRWRGSWAYGLRHGYGQSIDITQQKQIEKGSSIIKIVVNVEVTQEIWDRNVPKKEGRKVKRKTFIKDSYQSPINPDDIDPKTKKEPAKSRKQSSQNASIHDFQINVRGAEPIIHFEAANPVDSIREQNHMQNPGQPIVQTNLPYEPNLDSNRIVNVQATYEKQPSHKEPSHKEVEQVGQNDPSNWMKLDLLG